MSSDELRVPSQRGDDSTTSHGDVGSTPHAAQRPGSGGEPAHEEGDQRRGDPAKADPVKADAEAEREEMVTGKGEGAMGRSEGGRERLADGDERARDEALRDDAEAGLRSPRMDDEYAAAVPGAVSTPERGYDDDTPYRDPYARTGGDMLAEPAPTPGVTEAPAGREPAAVPGAATVPAHALPDEGGLFDQDPGQVQARWREVQTSFVDDPGEAVQRADGLVGEVVESLTSSLNSRTSALRGRWKDAEAPDTEQLRQALRDYRSVLERLLALSSRSLPGQGQAHDQGLASQGFTGQGIPGRGIPEQGLSSRGILRAGE
ncbi:hypothetical protein ABGB18_02370 [Nonomuraea sp. B12E4]|uniref:hypothetical protein n=1 Tax=Nonomuraea sp. B12E4 TaxID=3153564 RepID=UPI00325DE612